MEVGIRIRLELYLVKQDLGLPLVVVVLLDLLYPQLYLPNEAPRQRRTGGVNAGHTCRRHPCHSLTHRRPQCH
jgi:hypothetical protein